MLHTAVQATRWPYAGLERPTAIRFRKNQHIARENCEQANLYRIESGWACRFRLMADGRRQITALYLPGDLCEPQWALGSVPNQPVVALTDVRAVPIPCALPRLCDQARPLFGAILATLERQSSWLVSLGRKVASERVAHLLLDLYMRMRGTGLAQGLQCPMPLTQTDIADATGLTPVHVNRTLQALRRQSVVELKHKLMQIDDLPGLCSAAGPDWAGLRRQCTSEQEATDRLRMVRATAN